jgi:hypothetical protein
MKNKIKSPYLKPKIKVKRIINLLFYQSILDQSDSLIAQCTCPSNCDGSTCANGDYCQCGLASKGGMCEC